MTTTVSDIVAKMQKSGRYRPITDDEYKRLKAQQFSRVAKQEQEAYRPDYSRMGMQEDELSLTWDKIMPDISDAIEGANAVQPAYEQGYGMIMLWGTWGQGKTLIGKILTAAAIRDGKRAAYANMSRVLDNIRQSFDERENKTTELIRRMEWWIGLDVLFLDELDKINGTEWAESIVFELIDRRYTRAVREEAVTVIASNKSDGQLDGYLRSRLHDARVSEVVHLDGADGRESMPKGWKY